ncbi:MAG TPA: hypothetical protein V6C72_11355 [Chroococcales cyanobacterium]
MKPLDNALGSYDLFDLIEYQRIARESSHPKTLFDLWEKVCQLYDRHMIGSYELDEMKTVIWPHMARLTAISQAVEGSFLKQQPAA